MRLSVKSKHLYLLALAVICLLGIVIMPTYAKFGDEVTFDDVVGINLNYNIGISNIEQFEEVVLEAGESTSFNVNVTNSSGSKVYYGIWYKMVSPSSMPNDDSIKIGRTNDSNVSTSGGIEDGDDITSTIGLINNTNEEIKLYIGVASSSTSTNDIEYINGKYLVSGTVNVPTIFATYIKNLYDSSRAVTASFSISSSNDIVSLDSDSGIMLDNNGEYRYYGANPNNYVLFNGELWRVVSSSVVYSNESDIVGEQRVRIIKDASLGGYAWDINDNNDWSNSSLKEMLNGIYYNSQSGICYSNFEEQSCDFTGSGTYIGLNEKSRSLIDDALWYLGGYYSANYPDFANEFYKVERGSVGFGNNPTRWTGKVGILYVSDYMYATDLRVCVENTMSFYLDECFKNDWLYSKMSDNAFINPGYMEGHVYRLCDSQVYPFGNGLVFDDDDESTVDWDTSIHPVVYLKSDVKVYGGSGTSSDPYII